ncbi:MAG: hypothetical protein OEM38_06620 [Gammaproteobacteria bacterium]|nr:hypothetical protein [Gammaproteobacteria bacterium]
MKRVSFGLILSLLLLLPLSSFAAACDQVWFHVAGVSKHVEVYKPTEFTRYKRQTHPGFGVECKKKQYTLAAGEFTNSLDRPFQYLTASTDIASFYNLRLKAGMLVGEYGRTERAPLRLIAPIAYLDYQYDQVGINFFALPPAQGVNDYAIFYTQFKIRF